MPVKRNFYSLLTCFIVGLMLALTPALSYAESSGGGAPKPKTKKAKKGEITTITGGKVGGGEEKPIYLHLAPLVIPVINDGGSQQLVSMIIDFHIKDRESAEVLKDKEPIMKDAIITAMYRGLANGTMRNAHALDIDVIKNQIKKTVNEIFEDEPVLAVLIQAVSQRKL